MEQENEVENYLADQNKESLNKNNEEIKEQVNEIKEQVNEIKEVLIQRENEENKEEPQKKELSQSNLNEENEKNELPQLNFEEQRTIIFKDFCKAINSLDFEKTKEMIEKYQAEYEILNKYDSKLKTMALIEACSLPDDQAEQMLHFLIDQGADPNLQDKQQQTVMFYVCRDGKINCYKYLRQLGISITKEDHLGQISLFYACRDGRMEIIKQLIEDGVNINHLDQIKQTCLFYAAREGREDVCKYLIEKGIKYNQIVQTIIFANILNSKDTKKQTAITYAKKYHHPQVLQLLQSLTPKTKPGNQHSNLKRKITKDEPKIQYKLTLTDKNGVEKYLDAEEMEEFAQQYPEIAAMFQHPDSFITQDMIEEFKANDTWEETSANIIQHLWKLKGSYLFHQPVDIVKMQCDDYYDIIKSPMDFSTIKNKLNHNLYHNISECLEDINLVFANCILYNGETTEIGKVGVQFQTEFQKLCKIYDTQQFMKEK